MGRSPSHQSGDSKIPHPPYSIEASPQSLGRLRLQARRKSSWTRGLNQKFRRLKLAMALVLEKFPRSGEPAHNKVHSTVP